MSVEDMQESIRLFCSNYLTEGIDRAAENNEDLNIAILSCFEMATQLLKMNKPDCWKEELTDYLQCYMSDLGTTNDN